MPQPGVFRTSTVIITYRRDDALSGTLEKLRSALGEDVDHEVVLVDNNADGVDRSHMLTAFRNVRYIRSETNLGVAGGRNLGIENASGELLVFLDDDALLMDEDGLYESLVRLFDADGSLGVVAFRSHMRVVGESDPIEFPHTDKSLRRDVSFETFRFIGVGHAIRSAALKGAGPYYPSFFYGMEEFELCFRLMDLGWTIRYEPRFAVLHRKLPSGRLTTRSVARRMYANKLCLAWMHLPAKELLLCASAWAVKTLVDTRSPLAVVGAARAFIRNVKSDGMERRPKPHVVDRISKLGGIPWR